MGDVVPLPGMKPPAPEKLGKCDWCRTADAVDRVTVTEAKKKRGGAPLEPHERAVIVAACEPCAKRLRAQVLAREEEKIRRREAAAAKRRAQNG